VIDLASEAVGTLFLVFARIGSALMLVPGIGESQVPGRIRLMLALAVSLVLAPLVADLLPPLPPSPSRLALLVASEVAFGLTIGFAARLMLTALHIAGSTMAMQGGLAAAAFFDPGEGTQRSIFVTFLTAAALPLLFAVDGHHWFLAGLAGSYTRFSPGSPLPLGDIVELASTLSGAALAAGLQIAAPLMLLSILTNFTFGMLNRLMPTLQALMIAIPAQVLVAFFTLAFGIGISLMLAIDFFERSTAWLG
jgi:flagellar biosynthesis protein FliR